MKIALIVPESPFLERQDVMPPLGMWYISSSLKAKGHEVSIFDLGLGDIIGVGFDLYAVTATTPQLKRALQLTEMLSKYAIVVIGGPHISIAPQDAEQSGADYIIQGEGENFVGYLGQERIITIPIIKELDNLPFPDRSQADRYSYCIDNIPTTTMITSRGCPFNCSFCCKGVWGRKYRRRSVDNVIEEIYELRDKYGYQGIMFFDDTLMLRPNTLSYFFDRIASCGIVWRGFARADQINREIAVLMKKSGCCEVGIGVETGSELISCNINKKESPIQQMQAIKILKEVGIRVKAFLIVGLPGENWDTIRETDNFLSLSQPDNIDISILSVFPGCDIYNYPEKYDLEFGKPLWYKGKNGEYQCNVSTSAMNSYDILRARNYLYTKYRR